MALTPGGGGFCGFLRPQVSKSPHTPMVVVGGGLYIDSYITSACEDLGTDWWHSGP